MKANVGMNFLQSLDNEGVVLTPGEYIVMVDPVWNGCANTDKLYKKILIDIYSKDGI